MRDVTHVAEPLLAVTVWSLGLTEPPRDMFLSEDIFKRASIVGFGLRMKAEGRSMPMDWYLEMISCTLRHLISCQWNAFFNAHQLRTDDTKCR